MGSIKRYLSTEKFKSKQELAKETGLTERSVRQKISNLKFNVPVVYNSQTKGYRLAKNLNNITYNDLVKEIQLIDHCINDIQARKDVFNKQLRTYIAYKKVAEKILNNMFQIANKEY